MNIGFLALTALVCVAPLRAHAANAFMGHYGYMLTTPDAYSANPSVKGAIEVVDLFPKTCAGLKSRMECAKLGMIELYALSKRDVELSIGAKNLGAYADTILKDSQKAGLKSKSSRKKRAGFASALIEFPGHPQALNTMIIVEGSKIYYRFKFNDKAGAKTAESIIGSLKEIAPHDDPPR